jgi:hypothetical protein
MPKNYVFKEEEFRAQGSFDLSSGGQLNKKVTFFIPIFLCTFS